MPRLGAGKGIMEFRTRNIHVGTRLNEAEHKKLMDLCQRTGLGTTRLLRKLITDTELQAKPTPELREVLRAITQLNRERGITVVLITHHMNEAENADRVIVMNDGQVAMDGTPRQVFARVAELRDMGLAAPHTVELLSALNEEGELLPLDAITVDECADAICRAFGGTVKE